MFNPRDSQAKTGDLSSISLPQLPLNELIQLPFKDFSELKIREDGLSDHPELNNSIFVIVTNRPTSELVSAYRVSKDNVPEVGESRRMQYFEVAALKIPENGGPSDRVDLEGSTFEVSQTDGSSMLVKRV